MSDLLRVKYMISRDNYLMLCSLVEQSELTASQWVNLIINDFFSYTNDARLLHNIMIDDFDKC